MSDKFDQVSRREPECEPDFPSDELEESFLAESEKKRQRVSDVNDLEGDSCSVGVTGAFVDNILGGDAQESDESSIIGMLTQDIDVQETAGPPVNEQIIKCVHSMLSEKLSDINYRSIRDQTIPNPRILNPSHQP